MRSHNSPTAIRAVEEAVIGKIVLVGDPLGHPQIITTVVAAARI